MLEVDHCVGGCLRSGDVKMILATTRRALLRLPISVLVPGDRWEYAAVLSSQEQFRRFVAAYSQHLRSFRDSDEEGWSATPVAVNRSHFEIVFTAVYLSRLRFFPKGRSFALRLVDRHRHSVDLKVFRGGEVLRWSA